MRQQAEAVIRIQTKERGRQLSTNEFAAEAGMDEETLGLQLQSGHTARRELVEANLQEQQSRVVMQGKSGVAQARRVATWRLSREHSACLGVADGYGAKGFRPGSLHTHQEWLQQAHQHAQ